MTRPTRLLARRSVAYYRPLFSVAALALSIVLPVGSTSAAASEKGEDKPNFWLIPHTHWEGAVFKTREEYLEMGLPHILTVLRLLEEHPSYRFALDQLAYFKPFLERYPDQAATFRKFVADGRLQIVGGMNVMPDDNMPSGESFIRQLLYAKGYCREVLGVDVKVGWLIDTFGHHAQMPQILRLAGFNSFWFSRGVEDRAKMPAEFLWQGLDGTQIPAFWLPFSYGHLYGPPKDLAGFTEFMKKRWKALDTFCGSGADRVGLAGVDVSEPELYVPGLLEQFNQRPDRPFTLRIGVPTDFEKATAKRGLPVIQGERNPLFQGIYSSRIELKQWMRTAERLLTTAEKFGTVANWLGQPADDQMIWRAWDPALFNVTHDLASGVMTDGVYEDTLRSYAFSKRLADEMIETRLGSILARIDTTGQGQPLAVLNTLGWSRTDVAEGDVGFTEGGIVDFDLTDPAGQQVPAQPIETERFQDGGLRRIKFAFVARDVPALGHCIYHVAPRRTPGGSKIAVLSTNADGLLENSFYRASLDAKTGALTSLRVKEGDWEALGGSANVVAVETDNGDFWEPYKNLDGGQNVIMTRPMNVPGRGQAQFSDEFHGQESVVSRGPVFSEFHITHPLGTNTFGSVVRIYAGLSRIEFKTSILNRDRHVRYRALFPTTIKNGQAVHEIQFGAIQRPESQEFPAQNWIDLSNGERGVALLNRALPGNNISDGTLMVSLLRSTRIQSYGIGGGFEGQGSDSGLELGKELTLDYAILPHSGDWRKAAVYRAGLEFNQPLIVRKVAAHSGNLSKRWAMLDLSPANVVLSALKSAKDGSAVVRVYEANGQATAGARLKLYPKVVSAAEANLMEDPGAKLEVQQDTIQFDLHPFEIKTFKLRLEPAERASR